MPGIVTTGSSNDSPSYNRRKALREGDAGNNNMAIIPSYPLEKYFEIASRLLENFQNALDGRRLDETYVYGIRFCTFNVEALPKHPDYSKPKFQKLRSRNSKQTDKVLKTMEIVTQRMDVEETAKIRRQQQLEREEEEERQQEEERRRKQQEEEEERRRIQEEENHKRQQQQKQHDLEQSAYAKLQAMKDKMTQKEKKKQLESSSNDAPTKKGKIATTTTTATAKKSQSSIKSLSENTTKATKTKISPPSKSKTESTVVHPTSKISKGESPKPTKKKDPVSTPSDIKKKMSNATATSTQKRRQVPTTEEEKTIQMLEDTMKKQEKRLDNIDQIQIPTLLQQAKSFLREGNRKGALSCVRKKRKLEHLADISKGAIFQLETQIFQIETSIENQHIQEALKAASQAMAGIQKSVGGIDAETLQDELISVSSTTNALANNNVDEDDEEELLQELEQWTTPKKMKKNKTKSHHHQQQQQELDHDIDEEEISILSLPQVPLQLATESYEEEDHPHTAAKTNNATTTATKKKSGSVRGLLKAVLG